MSARALVHNQEDTMPDNFSPGLHDDLDEDAYHAHPTSLSHSGAKLLLKAPALFQWRRTHPEHKDVFDFGSAAHKRVLGIGAPLAVLDRDDWRGKEAAEFKVAAHEAGEIPLLRKDAQRIEDMADALASHTLAMRLLSDGKPEVSAFAVDEATGVMRRARFDWLGTGILTDYKTAAIAEPAAFARAAASFGYHMQAPWYLDLARDLGHPAQAFAFIVQEKTEPYLVSVVELDDDALDLGRRRNNAALQRFRDCQASGIWPGYQDPGTFTTLSLPRWAFYEETA